MIGNRIAVGLWHVEEAVGTSQAVPRLLLSPAPSAEGRRNPNRCCPGMAWAGELWLLYWVSVHAVVITETGGWRRNGSLIHAAGNRIGSIYYMLYYEYIFNRELCGYSSVSNVCGWLQAVDFRETRSSARFWVKVGVVYLLMYSSGFQSFATPPFGCRKHGVVYFLMVFKNWRQQVLNSFLLCSLGEKS